MRKKHDDDDDDDNDYYYYYYYFVERENEGIKVKRQGGERKREMEEKERRLS